jgi:hypothetical protein
MSQGDAMPQQYTQPSADRPQLPLPPVVICTKLADVGVYWLALPPQHRGVPSASSPQVPEYPEDSALNVPAGGDDSPMKVVPQHAIEPSARIAQACVAPALMVCRLFPVHEPEGPPMQMPAWQVSGEVQGSRSVHGAPSGFGALTQWPLFGSQVPASWH